MRSAILVLAALLQTHVPHQAHAPRHITPHRAHVPAKRTATVATTAVPVSRIDSLIASEDKGRLSIQVKGAVMGGGWKHAALKLVNSSNPADAHVLVLDFMAEPPEPTEAVIPGLLPVSAAISLKSRKGLVSVRVVSGSNEITTQILKAGR